MNVPRVERGLLVVIAVAIGVVIPAIAGAFWIYVTATIGVYALCAIGLNLCMGQAGIFSFAQPVFMGIGAFAYADLSTRFHYQPWLAALCSVLIAMLAAVAIGYPVLRLPRYYFAVASIIMLNILFSVIGGIVKISGGGIGEIPALRIGGLDLQHYWVFYWAIWIVVALASIAVQFLKSSRIGRAFKWVASNEDAAAAAGINVRRVKVTAFLLSGIIGAVAGFLLVQFETYFTTDLFNGDVRLLIFAMLFIGGIGTTAGPIIGAALVTAIPLLLPAGGLGGYVIMLFELVLLAILVLLPGGLSTALIQGLETSWVTFANQLGRARAKAAPERPSN